MTPVTIKDKGETAHIPIGDITSLIINIYLKSSIGVLPLSSRVTETRCYHTENDAEHQLMYD